MALADAFAVIRDRPHDKVPSPLIDPSFKSMKRNTELRRIARRIDQLNESRSPPSVIQYQGSIRQHFITTHV